MKKYNVINQHDETDCGVACLATIAKYYKINIPIYKLREFSKTNNEGSDLYGLANAAKKIGFISKCVKATSVNDISKEFNKPAIAHIITQDGLAHYVVIYSIRRGRITIGDPAQGIVKYKIDEFKKMWTGYLLILVPSFNFKVEDEENITKNIITELIIKNKNLILQAIILSLFISALTLATTMYSKILLDNIFPTNSYSNLRSITIIFFIVSLIIIILNITNKILEIYFAYRLTIPLNLSLINHMLNLPLNFFETRTTGEVLARINDVEVVSSLISKISIDIIINIIMAIVGGIILFILNSSAFILASASLIVYYVTFRIFRKEITSKTKSIIAASEKLNQSEIEIIRGIETIKTTTSSNNINNIYEIKLSNFIRNEIKFKKYMLGYGLVISIVKLVFNTTMSFVIATLVLDGDISIGSMIMFTTIFSLFINPIEHIINLQPEIQGMLVSLDRLKEVFIIKSENIDEEFKINNIDKDIIIKELTFSYTNRCKAIDGVNLVIKKNSMVGLVGKSGCGKSTLAKLLVSLYKAENGEIFYGDVNINQIGVNNLRKNTVYIDQEFNFLKDTIFNNLIIGLDEGDIESVIFLCKKMNIHKKIVELPNGYNTELQESASNLSQGEKQRLNIIRGLLKNPKILILDEVTSNLDYATEKLIFDYLKELRNNITIIVITHRLKSVESCDEIIYMEAGKILEIGSHNNLIDKKQAYYTMYNS